MALTLNEANAPKRKKKAASGSARKATKTSQRSAAGKATKVTKAKTKSKKSATTAAKKSASPSSKVTPTTNGAGLTNGKAAKSRKPIKPWQSPPTVKPVTPHELSTENVDNESIETARARQEFNPDRMNENWLLRLIEERRLLELLRKEELKRLYAKANQVKLSRNLLSEGLKQTRRWVKQWKSSTKFKIPFPSIFATRERNTVSSNGR